MRFTPQQLDNMWKRGLGDIICDCTQVRWTREDAFRLDSRWIKCGQHDKLDMRLFVGDYGGSSHPHVEVKAARVERVEEEEEAFESVTPLSIDF